MNGMAAGTRRERTPAPGGTAISRSIKNPTLGREKWGWRAAPPTGPAYAPAGPVPPKSSQACQTGSTRGRRSREPVFQRPDSWTGEQAGLGREATQQTLDKEHTWAEIQRFFATGKVFRILPDQSLIDTLYGWLVSTQQLTAEQAARTFPGPGYPGFLAGQTVMHAPSHKNQIHVHMKCVEWPLRLTWRR